MKILNFKKIVSIGFFAAFLAVFLSVGMAQASFWDWFNLNKANNDSQQAAAVANAETTYKWVNNGSVSKSDSRKTGDCSSKKQVTTYTCDSSTKGDKLYDGTNKGSAYGDIGNAWPIYEGENTSTATEYTYDGCVQDVHNTSGTVNEWECKSSDSSTTSSSSSSSASTGSYSAVTGSASNITSTSATLNGTITPNGNSLSYVFAYRKNSENSSATKYAPSTYTSIDGTSGDVSVSADISGLSSGTKYIYRLYVYNSATQKTTSGSVKYFTTSSGSSNSSSSSVSSGAGSSSSSVQQYTLKVKISGAGKVSGGDINCVKTAEGKYKEGSQGICDVKINKGAQVTLTVATPSTQYEFATWAEDCRSAGKISSCTIKMTGNKTVSATFNKKGSVNKETVSVSVRKTGKGVGKVISVYATGENSGKEDGRINCGSNCSENYEKICENTEGGRGCSLAYFKAVAEKGSTFSGWGNCITFKNEKDQCYVYLDGDKTINANFNEGTNNTTGKYYDLKVTVSEGGMVTSTDNKVDCSSSNSPCTKSYGKNGMVTLKITPNSGYALGDYSGCSKSGNVQNGVLTCKTKMTQNRNVKVNFKASGTSSSSSSSKSSSSTSANHTATTGSVTNITSTSATLNGTVNPKGENVSYIFSYGKKGVSGAVKNTSWVSAGSGSSDVSASVSISGLSSGTTYYYWISAYSYTTKKYVNSLNGDDGAAKTFTTSGSSSSSSSSSSQTTASVDLNVAEVKPGGLYGSTAGSISMTGNNSVILTWTVSAVKNCSISYDSNAKTIRSGTLSSSDIINESGASGKSGNTSKHNTEDYAKGDGSSSATYTLSCQKNSDNSSISDTVTVNY